VTEKGAGCFRRRRWGEPLASERGGDDVKNLKKKPVQGSTWCDVGGARGEELRREGSVAVGTQENLQNVKVATGSVGKIK